MNKYELALVVSAKVEDEVRDAVVEKAKGYITRYNGVITEVEEWGKKKLAYEIQKMHEGFYYFKMCIRDRITGLSLPRVHIDGVVWHLDVGSSHPGAVAGSKGWAVRPLKRYASWVQNVVRQFGPYPAQAEEI